MVRLRCEDAPVVGLAHLWLRHLPRWFLARMACVNMMWCCVCASELYLWRSLGLDAEAVESDGEEEVESLGDALRAEADAVDRAAQEEWEDGRLEDRLDRFAAELLPYGVTRGVDDVGLLVGGPSLPPSSSSVGWPSGVGSGVGGGGYSPDAGCMYGSDGVESDEEWRWGDYEGGLC